MKNTAKTLAVLSVILLLGAGCDDADPQTDCERWAELVTDCNDYATDTTYQDMKGGCDYYHEQGHCEEQPGMTGDCDSWDCAIDCSGEENCDAYRACRDAC